MTTITDDERKARAWLENAANDLRMNGNWRLPQYTMSDDAKHRATILALLDAPRMPRPEDVPALILDQMARIYSMNRDEADQADDMRAAYRALYDHYDAPPPRDAYGVMGGGTDWTVFASKRAALAYANDFPGSRIVRLVEAADEQ